MKRSKYLMNKNVRFIAIYSIDSYVRNILKHPIYLHGDTRERDRSLCRIVVNKRRLIYHRLLVCISCGQSHISNGVQFTHLLFVLG